MGLDTTLAQADWNEYEQRRLGMVSESPKVYEKHTLGETDTTDGRVAPQMRPYYDDGTCVIYHGDCREIIASLSADALVTDEH